MRIQYQVAWRSNKSHSCQRERYEVYLQQRDERAQCDYWYAYYKLWVCRNDMLALELD